MLNLRKGCRRSFVQFTSQATAQRSRSWAASSPGRKTTTHRPSEDPFEDLIALAEKSSKYQPQPDRESRNRQTSPGNREKYPSWKGNDRHRASSGDSSTYQRQNEPYPRTRNPEHRRQNEPYPSQLPPSGPYPRTRHPEIQHPGFFREQWRPRKPVEKPPVIPENRVVQYFQDHVSEWRARPHTHSRLVSYGLPADDATKLLNAFVTEVQAGMLTDPDYHLERFAQPHDGTSIDTIYSTVFFHWASKSEHQARFASELGVHRATLGVVSRLTRATARLFPADEYPSARTMHRKIIMHVGPTNSGKTHHALRALAAAKTGVYAGPLRLLAHEIWHRLNSGQIAPLGADEEAPKDPKGDPRYARLCNMVTGEEQKVMDGPVGHLSCTVEMLAYHVKYDVAVIDEIQMLSDISRGPGWVSSVLGIWAKEVHLCGEETAVPLVKALLANTGDEIEVRRYNRLTPLVVEEESLKGDFKKVRKGDCIVAFNRSGIFAIKKSVEQATGMRCAVVYGRLPPEVRSEQAALFNDPDSGYDVIVGSDAIGMGLNLKIKRVIFAATTKYDGQTIRPLDVSSVKQIAGRAGRYGLHKEQTDLGGTTTTLFEPDLPHLKKCVAQPYEPLPYVRIGFNVDTLTNVLSVLPASTSMHAALTAHKYIGRLPPYVRYSTHDALTPACNYIDTNWKDMLISDKVSLLYSPIPWRDQKTVDILRGILDQQTGGNVVDFMPVLRGTGLVEMVDDLEHAMRMQEAGLPSKTRSNVRSLLDLECLHKVLGFYLWMSFRQPLLYDQAEAVTELKDRLERVLNWSLEGMSKRLAEREGLRTIVRNQVLSPQEPKDEPLRALRAIEGTPADAEHLPLL